LRCWDPIPPSGRETFKNTRGKKVHMKQQIVGAGLGRDYDWSKDHVFVKTASDLTEGRVTVVEDTFKPNFHLPRHYHRSMTEAFYILEGTIEFRFDDETVSATPGMTVNIPPNVWHEVKCENGGKLITVFSPGGFDRYMEEMAPLVEEQFADEAFMGSLAEKYDSWMR
jgi:quercetin dioxygenase-like cupin family protein